MYNDSKLIAYKNNNIKILNIKVIALFFLVGLKRDINL